MLITYYNYVIISLFHGRADLGIPVSLCTGGRRYSDYLKRFNYLS